jgi:hypothetical protein
MRALHFLFAMLFFPILIFSCTQPDVSEKQSPPADQFRADRHEISRGHPRLLGDADFLRQLAVERPEAWAITLEQARNTEIKGTAGVVSCGLAYVIEGDQELGMHSKQLALEIVRKGVMQGHIRFGDALANIALAYDLTYPLWSDEEKQEFFQYFDQTVDANTQSETSVFHNGWYSYKHWGYGMAGYATYYEHERSSQVLADLEKEYLERVVPSFALAGDGGGWAEGYYVNYWIYEWTFFCEVASRVEGLDYFGISPEFMGQRAIAGMFEMYPGIGKYNSRRAIPMGDSGGRRFGSDRDKTMAARRILVNRFRDDPEHQVVNAFNELTPGVGALTQSYMDFLWRDTSVPQGDLASFRTSHVATGPGYVYARSDWNEDATYFFFKCGDRFTAHQHLDNGHFLIYSRGGELAADGGQYYHFGKKHDVNYQIRTVAHSTLRVYDPEESWHNIRAYEKLFDGVMDNDGGQHHDFPHHNGSVGDAQQWNANRQLYELADLLAFQDEGGWLYTAGDCSRAYKPKKLEYFTRQIVYIRPGTFVIYDRVRTTKPEYEKTWQLMAMNVPVKHDQWQVVTNGEGRLFVQTLLPREHSLSLHSGDKLHSYYGQSHPPEQEKGREPACRIEIKPRRASTDDYFLHVLTTTASSANDVPLAEVAENDDEIVIELGGTKLAFGRNAVRGWIDQGNGRQEFTDRIIKP